MQDQVEQKEKNVQNDSTNSKEADLTPSLQDMRRDNERYSAKPSEAAGSTLPGIELIANTSEHQEVLKTDKGDIIHCGPQRPKTALEKAIIDFNQNDRAEIIREKFEFRDDKPMDKAYAQNYAGRVAADIIKDLTKQGRLTDEVQTRLEEAVKYGAFHGEKAMNDMVQMINEEMKAWRRGYELKLGKEIDFHPSGGESRFSTKVNFSKDGQEISSSRVGLESAGHKSRAASLIKNTQNETKIICEPKKAPNFSKHY